MFRLLDIVLHKLSYQRANKVLIIIYFTALLGILSLLLMDFKIGNFTFKIKEQGLLDFPYIWHLTTYIAGFAKFFLLFVIVGMMTSEYSNNTLKQNLIDGLSKKELILSKCYLILLVSGIAVLLVGILTLCFGLAYSSFNEWGIVMTDWDYLLAFFMQMVGFLTLGLFIGNLIKKSAIALGLMLFWYIAEKILLYVIIGKVWGLDTKILKYLFPMESISDLIREPFTRMKLVKHIIDSSNLDIDNDYSVSYVGVLVVVAWTCLFVLGSYGTLKRRDF